MRAGLVGMITTPTQGNALPDDVAWCADNGCFSDKYVGDKRWIAWLARRAYAADRCWFATAPDVVGDAAATLERSLPWLAQIRALGLPAALVAQDGLENLDVPWDDFDVLFTGGSKPWKLSRHAERLVAEAHARGKRTHLGMVNTGKRYRYGVAHAYHSADGTTTAKYPRTIRDVLRWTAEHHAQEALL